MKNQVHIEPTLIGAERNAGAISLGGHAFSNGCPCRFEARIDFARVLLQITYRCQSSRHRKRIAAEGSGLIRGTERCQLFHQVKFSAEDADGQPAADNFSQRYQVGIERVELAGAAE